MPAAPPPPPPEAPRAAAQEDPAPDTPITRKFALLAKLREARTARRQANEQLIRCAQTALSSTPHQGYPLRDPSSEEEDDDDTSASGVRKLPPTERVTKRQALLDEQRQRRRDGAEALKRTAMGISCYSDSKVFDMPEDLRKNGADGDG